MMMVYAVTRGCVVILSEKVKKIPHCIITTWEHATLKWAIPSEY